MNKIGADATLRFDIEALLEGQQGQMMFSSMFMIDRFLRLPANLTLTVRCFLLIYHLQLKYFEPVLIDLHDHKQIITYILIFLNQ